MLREDVFLVNLGTCSKPTCAAMSRWKTLKNAGFDSTSTLLPNQCESRDCELIVLVKNHKEVEKQVQLVRTSAERTAHAMRMLLANEPEGLQVLKFVKFKEIGHHPVDDSKLNILEQANLTFAYLAKFEAARWLFTKHSELLDKGLELNLTSQSGFDIKSIEPDLLAAEVFSSSHPKLNNKLGQDIRNLAQRAAGVRHRYVFFSCPDFAYGRCQELEESSGIEVWSFPPELLLKSAPERTGLQQKFRT
jgi:hypothetical protein